MTNSEGEINLSDYLAPGDLFDGDLVYTAYVRSSIGTDYAKPTIELTIVTFSSLYDSASPNEFKTPLLKEKVVRRTLNWSDEPTLTLAVLKDLLYGSTILRPQYKNMLE